MTIMGRKYWFSLLSFGKSWDRNTDFHYYRFQKVRNISWL